MKSITLKPVLMVLLACSLPASGFSQCQPAVSGNTYWVTTDFDGGPGSLRQAILNANADNTGGTIEINGPWFNFPIFSQLPAVTCDSLTIFDYAAPITIDGQNMVFEPAVSFINATSCVGAYISGINFLAANLMVTNTNDSGPGSFRDALRNSNFSTSPDIIAFNIPGPAPHRIQVDTQLPYIYKSLTIDGSTQPSNGYNGTAPKIELDGVTKSFLGINFFYDNMLFQNNARVYGLYVHGFTTGIRTSASSSVIIGASGKGNVISGNITGMHLSADVSTTIQYNYIGTDTSGTIQNGNSNNGFGIAGGSPAGIHLVQNNVISGNGNTGGILFNDARNITLKGNLIGTDKTGSYAIPNISCGISSSASLLTIGGIQPGDGNLFSGNCSGGSVSNNSALAIDGDSITVIGNKFGTNLAGTDTIPNSLGRAILLNGHHVRIGGSSVSERNIITGSVIGIGGYLGSQNVIENNYIGTDVTGSVSFPNFIGISLISDSSIFTGNKISFNNEGIYLQSGSESNVISNNEIQSNQTNGIYNDWGPNTFTQNSIFNNGDKGIFNTLLANNGIAKPVITFVSVDSVAGTSLPGAIVELFYSLSGNFNAQGYQYISTVVADISGNWNYSGPISNPVYVTSTQTDSLGNTSEFSDLWPQVTDNVWPGDCNYDLIVDNLDFLYLGMAMGNAGPVRSNASLNWIAQPAPDWSTAYFSGINHKHADTDGNGVADMQDVLAINQNYGLLHPFRFQSPAQPATLYDFKLTAINDTIAPGGYASFIISAGSGTLPIPVIYGIKWSLVFNTALADTGSVFFDYSLSTLGNFPVTTASFEKTQFTSNRIDVAVSRINQTDTTNMEGAVCIIHIPVKQTISSTEVLFLNATDVLGVSMAETTFFFTVQTDSVIIDPGFVGVNEIAEGSDFGIFPNPCSDKLFISSATAKIKQVSVFDISGKLVFAKTADTGNLNIDTRNFKSGIYFIEITNINGFLARKQFIKE